MAYTAAPMSALFGLTMRYFVSGLTEGR